MKRLLWKEIQNLLNAAIGCDVENYTAKSIGITYRSKWVDFQEDVKEFLKFYRAVKYDLEHHQGVFATDKWLLYVVADKLYEKRKQKIVGVYEISNDVAHSAILNAISYVDGWHNNIPFTLAPTDKFTGELSWRLESGILPNRINGFTSRRLHKVFEGYKIRLVRKKYKNGLGGTWIAGVRA